jgi:hypothetical protein
LRGIDFRTGAMVAQDLWVLSKTPGKEYAPIWRAVIDNSDDDPLDTSRVALSPSHSHRCVHLTSDDILAQARDELRF